MQYKNIALATSYILLFYLKLYLFQVIKMIFFCLWF